MGDKKKKQPIAAYSPSSEKVPRSAPPTSTENASPAWLLGNIDLTGPHGFHHATGDDLITLMGRVKSVESATWLSLKQGGSHNIQVDRLCKEAKKRLVELELDDLTELFSVRMQGKERIWGVREGRLLKVLWWDPKHEICPSLLKHT